MRLSNLADYAVVLMSAAARHCGAARLAEGRLNATKLAQETGVPLPTAKKLVSRLTAGGERKGGDRGARDKQVAGHVNS